MKTDRHGCKERNGAAGPRPSVGGKTIRVK